MQVKMLKNRTAAASDGAQVNRYLRHETYTVTKELADAWIAEGAAEDPNAPQKPKHADEPRPDRVKPSGPQRRKGHRR